MAWSQLSVTALRDRLVTDELEKLCEESADPDGKLAEILGHVAGEIVSRVNAGRRKRSLAPVQNTGLYVPSGALRHAYAVARQLLSDSFPALAQFNGEDRKASVEAANEYLRALADNDADADDVGAESYIAADTTTGPRFGGQTQVDFMVMI